MNSAAVIPFFATAFFSLILAIFLFSLKKEKTEKQLPSGERVIVTAVKNRLLQLILLGLLVLSLLINGFVTLDASAENCSWRVINATTTGDTTSFESGYVCVTNEQNTSGENYLKLVLWASRLLGFYVLLLFFVTLFSTAQQLRRDMTERRGR